MIRYPKEFSGINDTEGQIYDENNEPILKAGIKLPKSAQQWKAAKHHFRETLPSREISPNCLNENVEQMNRSLYDYLVGKFGKETTDAPNLLSDTETKPKRIFQGDSLSPLLFVLALIPLTLILRDVKAGYDLREKVRINHLLFMDDLKLYGKNENQIDTLVNTVRVFSDDIRMEFGISKCAILIMKRGKIVKCDGIVMPGNEIMKGLEEEGYK